MKVSAHARMVHATATSDPKPRRILAIDYGRKKIGLALSDELGLTSQPLMIFVRTNRQLDLRRLREICHQYAVTYLIVGYPLHITGEAGEMAHESSRFAERLNKHLGIPTELVDERLTTWEAKQAMLAAGSSRQKHGSLDDVAAAILLRDYLQKKCGPADIPARRD